MSVMTPYHRSTLAKHISDGQLKKQKKGKYQLQGFIYITTLSLFAPSDGLQNLELGLVFILSKFSDCLKELCCNKLVLFLFDEDEAGYFFTLSKNCLYLYLILKNNFFFFHLILSPLLYDPHHGLTSQAHSCHTARAGGTSSTIFKLITYAHDTNLFILTQYPNKLRYGLEQLLIPLAFIMCLKKNYLSLVLFHLNSIKNS